MRLNTLCMNVLLTLCCIVLCMLQVYIRMGFPARRRRVSSLRTSLETYVCKTPIQFALLYFHHTHARTHTHTHTHTHAVQMCLRINNIHLLISIFPALEAHLHSITRRALFRPATAFGYISSDVGDHPSPFGPAHGHTPSRFGGVGGSVRSKVSRDLRGTLTGSSDHSHVPRGVRECVYLCTMHGSVTYTYAQAYRSNVTVTHTYNISVK